MRVFELTRQLIDIESVTPNEYEVGEFLFAYLSRLAERYQGTGGDTSPRDTSLMRVRSARFVADPSQRDPLADRFMGL